MLCRRTWLWALVPLVVLASSMALAAPRVVLCIGDSLTEGLGVAKDEAYPALVEQMLAAKGYHDVKVVNAGISGATSAAGLAQLKWHLKNGVPAVLLLELGANDGLHGADLANLRGNLDKVIAMAKERGVPHVLIAGMRMPPNFGKDYTAGFAAVFPAAAFAAHVDLLPFLLEHVAGERTLNQADGIHPNAAGHKLVAGNVTAALLPLLGPP